MDESRRTGRRTFLRASGALLAGALSASRAGALPARRSAAHFTAGGRIPPHRALEVPGVHAYTGRQSVRAGETIAFHVSSSVPYRLSVCRLGPAVDDPSGDEILKRFDPSPPLVQPIHPGSYVRAEKGLEGNLSALSLECWVRPWATSGWMGLLGQHDYPERCGYGLFCAPGGALAFYLGGGGAFAEERLLFSAPGAVRRGEWHHVAGTWDGTQAALWIDGRLAGQRRLAGPVQAGGAPLCLAAYEEQGVADHFLDGDLALPAIHTVALTAGEIRRRVEDRGLEVPRGGGVAACWSLAEERGEVVADASGNGRTGRIVNHATWMVGGPSFDPAVGRFADYDPQRDPRRGHGLRFAADDLYDCRWQATHSFRVPQEARPGIYVGRLEFTLDGEELRRDVTVVVRRAREGPAAPILVLAATNTWLAYNSAPFSRNLPGLHHVCGTGGLPNSPGEPPAFSLYRAHAAGQGTYQLGLRMPWPAAGPYILYGGPTRYSHLARAERFLHVWLEKGGYDFDLACDLDLHREPELLRGRRVFVINGHSEYWSLEMYRALEAYLDAGGQAINFSGNTLFWRVSFDAAGQVMECRKVDCAGNQMPPERRGECWHSHDGRRGGLLRDCGYPGWKLLGLETLGWIDPNRADQFGPYFVEAPEHFLFERPHALGLERGGAFGAAPGGVPGSGGHEVDVRPSTLAAVQALPPPAGGVVPEDPPGMVLLGAGRSWREEATVLDYFCRPGSRDVPRGAELVYWERPAGGRVLNAGAVSAGWALHGDERFSRFLKNVLAHFGV